MSIKYFVTITNYAQSYYIKRFKKQHESAWPITEKAIIVQYERLDNFLETSKAKVILKSGNIKIIKSEFSVAGTKISPKKSGNKCIAAIDINKKTVKILLVYCKGDVSNSQNETFWWRKKIIDNYLEYKSLF